MMRHQLANGVELVVCPRDGANVLTIQCVIWAGSLDEAEGSWGVAHFLEHMLFKGTKTRGVGQLASLVEGAGGDINAYTTFDKTVFHLTLPSSSAELGFDVLSDAIFNSSFDEAEFEKEREVILEEIRRGDDDPGSQVGKKINQEIFADTAAGRPIIGYAETVSGFKRQTLVDFWSKWYQPENMSVIVAGNISSDDSIALAERYFGAHEQKGRLVQPGSGRHRAIKRARRGRVRAVVMSKDFEQTRLHIVLGAPQIDSPDCPLVDTAAYVLGGSDVSRLQSRLKEKESIVNAIGASSFTPTFEGLFEISAALDPENFAKVCRSVAREVNLLMTHDQVTQQEIDRARAAAKISRIHREETIDGVASAVVSGLSTPLKEKFENFYEYLTNNFYPSDLTAALRRTWNLNDVLIVAFCHQSQAPSSADLENAFLEGLKFSGPHAGKKSVTAASPKKAISSHHFNIGSSVQVIYREIPSAQMFSMVAVTDGGQRGETPGSAGVFHAMTTMMGLASKRRSYEEFTGRLEDLGAGLSGFSGKDSLGMELLCTFDQAKEMIDHLAENMLEPEFPNEQWQAHCRETQESLKLQLDSPSWICMRRLYRQVFGSHSYALPIIGYENTVKSFTSKALLQFYEQWRDGGRWIFAAAGGIPADCLQDKMSQAFRNFNPQSARRQLNKLQTGEDDVAVLPLKPKRAHEQAHIAMGGEGPRWKSSDREAVDFLINILGGQGGRLFSTLREQESLAYSVSPLISTGVDGGLVGAYLATSKDKIAQAEKSLARELLKISTDGPSMSEVNRARTNILGLYEIGLQRVSSQAMTMALMELYELGWDEFLKYPERIKAVSQEDIARAASTYFDPAAMKMVTVGS